MLHVRDGESIAATFDGGRLPKRTHAIPFRFQSGAAIIDGDFKLISTTHRNDNWQLYDLKRDPAETTDLSAKLPERFAKMRVQAMAMVRSVDASIAGQDYPEGKVIQPPRSEFWNEMPAYRPHFAEFFKRPEYAGSAKKASSPPKEKKRRKDG